MAGEGNTDDGWHTSSASGGECVEVRIAAEHVHVRNSRSRRAELLTFTFGEWQAFLTGVRLGEFDVPAD